MPQKLKPMSQKRMDVVEYNVRSVFARFGVTGNVSVDVIVRELLPYIESYGEDRHNDGWDEAMRSDVG